MAIFSSSSSFIRYLMMGDIPESFNQTFTENVTRNRFLEIEESSETEKTVGWVSLGKIMGSNTAASDFLRQEYIALSIRTDTKKVPSQILKTACLREEMKIKEKTKRENLSSPEKKELRENVRQRLLKHTFPSTALFDFCWNIPEKKVLFSSSNDMACLDFTDLFQKTFGLQLRPLFPYTIALGFSFSEEKIQAIDKTFPCEFTEGS